MRAVAVQPEQLQPWLDKVEPPARPVVTVARAATAVQYLETVAQEATRVQVVTAVTVSQA